MKSFLFILFAIILYGTQNVIVEQKLKNLQPLVVLLHCFPVMLLLTIVSLGVQSHGTQIVWPTGSALGFLGLSAVIYFVANVCYFNAFHSGGSLLLITTMTAFIPIVATLVKFAWVRHVPTTLQMVGMALAVVAVALVTMGNAPAAGVDNN